MNNSIIPDRIETALQTGSPDEILAATLAHFACQAGTVHRFVEPDNLALVAHRGIPPVVAQVVETVPVGKGIAGLAAKSREPVTICNLQSDTSGHSRPGARQTGMEGSLAVPMLVNGELRGVLGIAMASAHNWSEAEKALLLMVAARLGEVMQAESTAPRRWARGTGE